MKKLFLTLLIFLCWSALNGQNQSTNTEGKVSYVTTQNIYVKFQSTENILSGDTLFADKNGVLIPMVTVKDISSISCVCIPISSQKLSVGDAVFSRQKQLTPKITADTSAASGQTGIVQGKDSLVTKKESQKKRTQIITGNLSVASYLNFSNVSANSERMKYTFAMVMQNIGNSKISAETYISFAHKLGEWSTIQDDIFNGLRIYSLAFNYAVNKHNTIWLGRKINPRISNVGAIDGLQYEFRAGKFTVGLIGGTRPDYQNYSFNASLFQFGGYLGHDLVAKNGSMQTTVAFIQQMNSGMTDRRFAYFQHTNSLIRNLYFFGSAEVRSCNEIK